MAGDAGAAVPADLFDYLAHEVLGGLPPERQRFLVEASVLSEWTAAACNWLLDSAGSEAHLAWLRRTQLLVTAGPDGALRPHHLWQEFLQTQLGRNPERYRQLLRRAALWASGRDVGGPGPCPGRRGPGADRAAPAGGRQPAAAGRPPAAA